MEGRRAGTLATVAAAMSRWRSEDRLWPPCLVTLRRGTDLLGRPQQISHSVHTKKTELHSSQSP